MIFERLMPDHEGEQHLDPALYEAEPNIKKEPKPGSPEWRKELAKKLEEDKDKKDYPLADARKKREVPSLSKDAAEAAKKRKSAVTRLSNLLKPEE